MQCLSKTAITIFNFISYLSWLDIDETIRPPWKGLRSLYHTNDSIGGMEGDYSHGKAFELVIRLLTGMST